MNISDDAKYDDSSLEPFFVHSICLWCAEVIRRSPGTWISMPSCKMFQVKAEIVNTIGTPTDIVIKLYCLKDTGQILNAQHLKWEKERKIVIVTWKADYGKRRNETWWQCWEARPRWHRCQTHATVTRLPVSRKARSLSFYKEANKKQLKILPGGNQ